VRQGSSEPRTARKRGAVSFENGISSADAADSRRYRESAPISFISLYPHIAFPYTVHCSELVGCGYAALWESADDLPFLGSLDVKSLRGTTLVGAYPMERAC
jgi:hypothetical protein